MKFLKRKAFGFIGLIFLVLGVSVVVDFVNLPQFHVKDETITRNLGWLMLPMDLEPTDVTTDWDSELPRFVQQDMEYAEEHGYGIMYQFKRSAMRLELQDNEWILFLEAQESEVASRAYIKFSMYLSQKHEIVVYGYLQHEGYFQKITFCKDAIKIRTVMYNTPPEFNLQGDVVVRDLEKLLDVMDLEPTGRKTAWDSELPDFVQEDLDYAQARGYDVEYEFKGNIIHMTYREGEWELALRTRMDTGSTWDSLMNFSMYRTEDNKIILYGHTFMGEWFQKITLKKNESRIDTLTYDVNLPLDEYSEGKSIGAIRIGDYSMIETSGDFFFYKDGKCICYQSFPHGDIKEEDLYRGLILTTDNKLYSIYVSEIEKKPTITFVYVDTADKIIQPIRYRDNLRIVDGDLEVALVWKDGEIYIAVPEDWDSFDKFALANFNRELFQPKAPFNYAMQLVNLQQSLKEIYFKATTSQWYANIIFELNGREFYKNYFFDGYDDSVILPEEVKELFNNKRVVSFEEMWEIIEDIRTAYFDYYEHRGDFVPAVPPFYNVNIIVLFIAKKYIFVR